MSSPPTGAWREGHPDRRSSILLVDDREDNLLALEAILQDLGQEMVRARSGQEALRLLMGRDFAVILLDVRMPDIDGFETAQLIRKRERSRHTPIIFVTAADETPDQLARGYSAGAVDYISKPFTPEILKSKVRVFLDLFNKTEELRESELRFRTLVANIPGALYRREGESPWDILFLSDPIEKISGWPAGDFVEGRRPFLSLLHSEDVRSLSQTLKEAIRTRTPYALEYRILHRDGRTRWIYDKGRAVAGNGGEPGILDGVMFDVTDRRGAEEEIRRRTEELSRANSELTLQIAHRQKAEEERSRMSGQLLQGQKLQAIGQLAAGIAHEINNPVGYILSNTNTGMEYLSELELLFQAVDAVLRDGASGPEAARARASLDGLRSKIDAAYLLRDFRDAMRDIKEGAERIRDIVRSLREFTHLDSVEWKPAVVNEVLESAIRLCWNEIKYKAQIHRDFGDLSEVECHPQQIEQVFVNLLVNAAQAIDKKGEIFVTTKDEERHAVIRIRDTGCGIPAELKTKLFEPFFTTKPVGKGTGLGLHVVHKIVHAHRGKIDVTSTAGQGTEVTVRLPYTRAAWDGEKKTSPAESRREPVVVVVDDDATTLKSLGRLLEGEPYTLRVTERPGQVLEWVGKEDVSLVISDQRMEDMTGTDLLEQVLRRSPGTRCMLLTAYPDGSEVVKSLHRGVEVVISKPWDGDGLRRRIRESLAGRRGSRP